MDDLMVKSKRANDHPQHLAEVLAAIFKHEIWLNPIKCIFEVTSGKFLGHLETRQGIKANLDQIHAIHNMKIPTTQKEVQEAEKIVALSHFIS